MVQVLKLHEGVVLVPRSLALIFNLTVSAHKNNSLVNTMMVRALVDTLTVRKGEPAGDRRLRSIQAL